MESVLGPIAAGLHDIAPAWLVLPSLTFSLPHALYWFGLLLFPPAAMVLTWRAAKAETRRISVPTAYLLWLWGGFAGLHRFYLSSRPVGLIYVALFVLLLLGNGYTTDARNVQSAFNNDVRMAEFMVTKHQKDVDRKRAGAEERLAAALVERDSAILRAAFAARTQGEWRSFVGTAFVLILLLLAVDAFRIPGLVRSCEQREHGLALGSEIDIMQRGTVPDEREAVSNRTIRAIERLSDSSGQFVAYWTVLAVFVYYFEVIARYVFNSPTNWAHEAMFLMFGMQYLLSGACTLRDGKHVRVDVIYNKLSTPTRARLDIATSVVFFIFMLTLIVTGFLFARDAFDVLEVSFTEWAIQYWPVKFTILIGGILMLLQGFAALMRNALYLSTRQAG